MTSRNTTIQDILSVLMNDIYPENKSSNVPFNLNSLFQRSSPEVEIKTNTSIKVDMNETEDKIVVIAELPGISKRDIQLDVYNNSLVIRAVKTKNRFSDDYTSILNEIGSGTFERRLTLPICITDKKTVSTVFEDGHLTITINKLIEEENRFSISLQ